MPFPDRFGRSHPSLLGMRLLACLALLPTISGGVVVSKQQNDPRLRILLPSGAIAFAESMPGSKYFCLQLFASSRGARDTAATHGWRHLLEHLLTKGPDKVLEARLESQGVFLTAETQRDAMNFSFVGPPEKIDLAIAAVREILQPLRTTEKEIEMEARILVQEIALAPRSKKLSQALWISSFGTEGLDPIGNPEAIAKATVSSLELMRRRHFAPQNLVLSLVGPVEVDASIKQLIAILPKEKGPFEPDATVRKTGVSSTASLDGAHARGAPVPGWDEPETAAALAAALALGSEGDNRFVIYTPSTQPGLVILGSEEPNSGLGDWIQKLKPFEIDALFARSKLLAEGWVKRYLNSPEGCAFLRGFLYAQRSSATPDAMLENIRRFTIEQFRAGVEKFRSGGQS